VDYSGRVPDISLRAIIIKFNHFHHKKMKSYYFIIFFAILVFSFSTVPNALMSKDSSQTFIEPPDTLEGLKTMVLKALTAFPAGFKEAFNEAKIIWNKLYIWVRGWWSADLSYKFKSWVNRTWEWLKSLFFKREAIFKEELDKEKKEMGEDVKKEIPELQKTFLEKFKEIIK